MSFVYVTDCCLSSWDYCHNTKFTQLLADIDKKLKYHNFLKLLDSDLGKQCRSRSECS